MRLNNFAKIVAELFIGVCLRFDSLGLLISHERKVWIINASENIKYPKNFG